MASLTDLLQSSTDSYLKAVGARVVVKTDLGPSITVYDADAPGGGGGGGFASPVKFGVQVRARDGSVITEYGQMPPTNPLKLLALVAVVGGLIYVIARGVSR